MSLEPRKDTDVPEMTARVMAAAFPDSSPALQALVLDRVGPRVATQAMAVQSSSVHVGAALGGVLGGAAVAVITGLLPVVAASTAALALLVVMAGGRWGRRSRFHSAAAG